MRLYYWWLERRIAKRRFRQLCAEADARVRRNEQRMRDAGYGK